jgi:hypothetical protein
LQHSRRGGPVPASEPNWITSVIDRGSCFLDRSVRKKEERAGGPDCGVTGERLNKFPKPTGLNKRVVVQRAKVTTRRRFGGNVVGFAEIPIAPKFKQSDALAEVPQSTTICFRAAIIGHNYFVFISFRMLPDLPDAFEGQGRGVPIND